MNSPDGFYLNKLEAYSSELQSVSLKLKRFAWYRFFSFASIVLPVSFLGFQWYSLVFTLCLFVFFFALVKHNAKFEKRKKKLLVLKKLVEDEQLALNHSFLHFYNGKEFLDTEHFFSYDLDLFGEGSLFQFINRTSTVCGRLKLADWFVNPSKSKVDIEKKQDAVRELAQSPEWRLLFRAKGNLFQETEALNHEINSWSQLELDLNRPQLVKWLIRILPLLTIISIIPAVLGISNAFLTLFVFIQFILMYFFWKRINQYFSFFGRKSELLAKYMQLLQFVEEGEFCSEYLLALQQKIRKPSAGKLFSRLKSLVKELEYRQNILVGVVLNGLFLWDIRCVYKLWEWHKKHRQQLAEWLNVVAETDALISLGNYANNHHEYVYPEIIKDGFLFETKELGHPLLKFDKRVCNNLEIRGWSKVMVVTGANMAGKSTFLRTVGVNLILARLGVPVCAAKMKVTPIDIYTNMRTSDSLLKDESYFFAELKRIKVVLDRLQNGEHIFVILDEMLKGTNSVDKLSGSKALIRRLMEFESVSLIATHDLKLSELENEFPQQIFNKCFEIRIENEELIFDYKLSDGVTKTMNATFLMKKMGII